MQDTRQTNNALVCVVEVLSIRIKASERQLKDFGGLECGRAGVERAIVVASGFCYVNLCDRFAINKLKMEKVFLYRHKPAVLYYRSTSDNRQAFTCIVRTVFCQGTLAASLHQF